MTNATYAQTLIGRRVREEYTGRLATIVAAETQTGFTKLTDIRVRWEDTAEEEWTDLYGTLHALVLVEEPAPAAADRPLTLAEARKQLKDLGYNLRREEGETQIKPHGAVWTGPRTYYPADLADAIGTARAERFREAEGIIRRAHRTLGPDLGGSYTDLLCDNLPVSVAVAADIADAFTGAILDSPTEDATWQDALRFATAR